MNTPFPVGRSVVLQLEAGDSCMTLSVSGKPLCATGFLRKSVGVSAAVIKFLQLPKISLLTPGSVTTPSMYHIRALKKTPSSPLQYWPESLGGPGSHQSNRSALYRLQPFGGE